MTETYGVRRSLLVEGVVFTVCLGGVLASFGLVDAHDYLPVRVRYLWIYVAFLELLAVAWLVRSLAHPWWFRLDDHGLTVSWVLRGSRTIPLGEVDSHLGNVIDVPRNRRFQVGEARFPGAEKLHRAIRVRKTVERLRTGAD